MLVVQIMKVQKCTLCIFSFLYCPKISKPKEGGRRRYGGTAIPGAGNSRTDQGQGWDQGHGPHVDSPGLPVPRCLGARSQEPGSPHSSHAKNPGLAPSFLGTVLLCAVFP